MHVVPPNSSLFPRFKYQTRLKPTNTRQKKTIMLGLRLLSSSFFLLGLITTTTVEPTIAGKVPAIIVFGDSTVDAGNNNFLDTPLKCDFSPYGRDFDGGKITGRWSNGRVATDFISEGFGLKKTLPAFRDPEYTIKDFATGVDFASAGTGFDPATAHIMVLITNVIHII